MFRREAAGLSGRWREILACAYELTEGEIADDAAHVRRWAGSDKGLIANLETRHGWSVDSELGPYYLAAVRRALA